MGVFLYFKLEAKSLRIITFTIKRKASIDEALGLTSGSLSQFGKALPKSKVLCLINFCLLP